MDKRLISFDFIHNISSVATYESKILLRSWFFKIFTLLAIGVLSFFNVVSIVIEDGANMWILKAVASNIPYINILLLNTGQAVVAIFLASEFLKRDKQLDTSEVFYVRPLSNAEYVFGKIWGNLRVFFVLSLIVMAITMALNAAAKGTSVDWQAYIIYFFLITVPTLIFIMGLAIFLMLTLKNQAVTFILLLGYIGVTIFYIGDSFYYLFDYMAYSLPLFKSSIVGFGDLGLIVNHRAIYLFLGIGFILYTIGLFRRLPNSAKGHYPWMVMAFLFFGLGAACGYNHVNKTLQQDKHRARYTELNNTYVHTPKMVIDAYKLTVKQFPDSLQATATLVGKPLEAAQTFTFCLNPGLKVTEITQNGTPLSFERKDQILLVDFGKELTPTDSTTFSIVYAGYIDESLCYLDIKDKELREKNTNFLINIGKKYSFMTADYLMVTPETFWYPRPGTAYSNTSPDWQQTYFSQFTLEVEPIKGLKPISQGVVTLDSIQGKYTFTPDYAAQTLSLVIGDYKQKEVMSDSVLYSIHYIDGHDYFSAPLDSIKDTLPKLIKNTKQNLERQHKLSYPFKRFSLVEVPGQFKGYARAWTGAQETAQPEMMYIVEKGFNSYSFDIQRRVKNRKRWGNWDGKPISEKEAQIKSFEDFCWLFYRDEGRFDFSEGERGKEQIKSTRNPYFMFPLLYNFRYNIFSPDWPIANRVVEVYLQNKTKDSGWERQINGISNNEKASLLMEHASLNELLGDAKHSELTDNFVTLQGSNIFAEAEINAGVTLFRDSLYRVLERNTFKNVQFEHLLDTLGKIGDSDINSFLATWDKPTPLPRYSITKPEVKHIKNRDGEAFVFSIEISNESDYPGVIHLTIGSRGGPPDPRGESKVILKPNETKRLVSHWERPPSWVSTNTLISQNLPSFIYHPMTKVQKLRNVAMEPEGEYIIQKDFLKLPEGEIIVDNEDSLLFSMSAPEAIGILPKLLDRVEDDSFEYSGISWWGAPLHWTLTTDGTYYGKYIRSAYVIKGGDGSQTATWTVPVPEPGRYEVFFHLKQDYELRWNRNVEAEYEFKVEYNNEIEDAYIDLRKAAIGWEPIGMYDIESDTVKITLSNKCKMRTVTADAVRFVKQ